MCRFAVFFSLPRPNFFSTLVAVVTTVATVVDLDSGGRGCGVVVVVVAAVKLKCHHYIYDA